MDTLGPGPVGAADWLERRLAMALGPSSFRGLRLPTNVNQNLGGVLRSALTKLQSSSEARLPVLIKESCVTSTEKKIWGFCGLPILEGSDV